LEAAGFIELRSDELTGADQLRKDEFVNWLSRHKRMKKNSIQSRVSNCRRVEEHVGDLDDHYRKDKMHWLSARLRYSKNDEARKCTPFIPIDGNEYDGMATLRAAVNLYVQFCDYYSTGIRD